MMVLNLFLCDKFNHKNQNILMMRAGTRLFSEGR